MSDRAGTPADPGGPTLASVGEFGLIAAVTARMPQGPGVVLGPGDDAAVVHAPDGRVVVTTDLLVAGRHFRHDWSSAYDVGRKAAAQNLADVAAMGAVPTALVVGLAAPPDLGTAWAAGLADGLRDECSAVGASVVGGDLVRADTVLVAVTALGDLQGRAPLTRAGARAGDVVAVRGRLGWAAAGLAVLTAGELASRPDTAGELASRPDTAGELADPGTATAGVVAAHRRPRPDYAAGPDAAALGATALIDTSDGLLADLGHVARASDVAMDLDSAALGPDAELLAAAELLAGADGLPDPAAAAAGWVLTGGEDHAFAACFPGGTVLPGSWRVVGRVDAPGPGGPAVTVDGAPWVGPAGWDHFA